MIRIIGISGKARMGKDYTGKILQLLLQKQIDTDMGFPTWEIKKFAGKLKQTVSLLTGLSEEDLEKSSVKESHLDGWNMTVREMLQKLGTESIRLGLHKDAWILALFSDFYKHSNWIITDVRFPNEADAIKSRGGLLLRVNRDVPTLTHISETALDNYDFDYYVDNNGTKEELEKQLIKIVKELKLN